VFLTVRYAKCDSAVVDGEYRVMVDLGGSETGATGFHLGISITVALLFLAVVQVIVSQEERQRDCVEMGCFVGPRLDCWHVILQVETTRSLLRVSVAAGVYIWEVP